MNTVGGLPLSGVNQSDILSTLRDFQERTILAVYSPDIRLPSRYL